MSTPGKKRGLEDSAELPAIPTPETDARLRIPEELREGVPGRPASRPKAGQGDGKGGEVGTDMAGMGRAWAMGFDLVGMSLAGAGLGWLVDRWLQSMPIGVVVGLGVGFASALVRVVRAMNRE